MRGFEGFKSDVPTGLQAILRRSRRRGKLESWLLLVLMASFYLVPPARAQTTITYIHTDALGSVVAKTDESGNVIERYDYEPYGAVVGGQVSDGPLYTGHVSDAATGLSYMQQRYYDPQIGRFLSVDPVTANTTNGGNFNRYWYANNNPYKFTDPDGRQSAADRFSDAFARDPAAFSGPEHTVPAVIVTAVMAAPLAVELGMTALANPVATTAIANEVGAAVGVTGTAAVGAGAAIRNADDVAAAAGGVLRSSGDTVASGGRAAAKALFRASDAAGKGARQIVSDKTGGGKAVVGKTADGEALRIRMKPDGTTRIQAADKKIIYPKEK